MDKHKHNVYHSAYLKSHKYNVYHSATWWKLLLDINPQNISQIHILDNVNECYKRYMPQRNSWPPV